jgi:hypothetical protein
MSGTTHTTRRALVSAAVLTLSVLALGAFRPASDAARHGELSSAYFAQFAGRSADGREMIWRGAIAGAAVGEFTVRLTQTGQASDPVRGKRPVEGTIMVVGEDPARAFAAQVRGTIDWQARRLALTGQVTTGDRRGTPLTQTAELTNSERVAHNLSGEMHFGPAAVAAAQ